METTFEIPEYRFPEFVKAFKKLKRAAVKCRCAPPAYTATRFAKEVDLGDGRTAKVAYQRVEVTGEAPRIGEYRVVAKVDPMGEHNVVRGMGGVDPRFRTTGTVCEHCNKQRSRVYLYVVQDASGNQLQVGKSCLKDFMGHATPAALASYFTYLEQLSAFDFDYTAARVTDCDLVEYLGWVAACTHEGGWFSASAAREVDGEGTAGRALRVMRNAASYGMLSRWDKEEVDAVKRARQDEDVDVIAAALAWVRGLPEAERQGDYLHNLATICEFDMVQYKHIGIAGSLLAAYKRATTKPAAKCAPVSKYIGEVGGKVNELAVRVVKLLELDGVYGVTRMYTFETEAGDVLIWYGTGNGAYDLMEFVGKSVVVRGTVKQHSEYKGVKQTVLTRVKWSEV